MVDMHVRRAAAGDPGVRAISSNLSPGYLPAACPRSGTVRLHVSSASTCQFTLALLLVLVGRQTAVKAQPSVLRSSYFVCTSYTVLQLPQIMSVYFVSSAFL